MIVGLAESRRNTYRAGTDGRGEALAKTLELEGQVCS